MGEHANVVTLHRKTYTSTEGNVSHDLDWRFGGTIVSSSFFSSHGEASWKGRRTVMLRAPSAKTVIRASVASPGKTFWKIQYVFTKFNKDCFGKRDAAIMLQGPTIYCDKRRGVQSP